MFSAGRMPLSHDDDPVTSNQTWWDANATQYLDEHGEILGDTDFIWGPEGIREADLNLLGTAAELKKAKILEIGAGAAQCSRYLHALGCDVTATDISDEMIKHAARINERFGYSFPLLQADARSLPFDANVFDVVFTSFGVIPFVENLEAVHNEVKRVLKPHGKWIYSAMHPIRWMFPDDPTRRGMAATSSYFGTEPYLERNSRGELEYAEFHHTFAEHINSLTACGFSITEVIEPQWPLGRNVVWGGWGPERSAYIPGTLIVCAVKGAQ
ncbi:ubiquinone/menaquinone biosynthesis C-methylase UbiE [Arcanobacterium pluranimalium]|uniref:class I SAM-dependent methyltransferase n=1 Tax=Arcanobacterium pluranimalium TaxID=108028 RepID=UPI00195F193C|nr:class I SAM-dependent methyltransferase [Arcanobacterium pluranimalium]MBM7825383.1 ubiquinone/menaquinone biosynthesis C-methylase UbiE [Arcanobacterium pluranimalium]